jgi:hypothetical protein
MTISRYFQLLKYGFIKPVELSAMIKIMDLIYYNILYHHTLYYG